MTVIGNSTSKRPQYPTSTSLVMRFVAPRVGSETIGYAHKTADQLACAQQD